MARAAMGSAGGPVLPEGGGPRRLITGKTIESVPPSLYHAPVNCRRGKPGNIAPAVRTHTPEKLFCGTCVSEASDQARCLASYETHLPRIAFPQVMNRN